MKFVKQFGSWYLMDGDQILYMADDLAFAFSFDQESGSVLHKHGPRERVEKWASDTRWFYIASGTEFGQQMADEIVVVSSSDWDVELVQKFIDISGYIGRWYKKYGKSVNL